MGGILPRVPQSSLVFHRAAGAMEPGVEPRGGVQSEVVRWAFKEYCLTWDT